MSIDELRQAAGIRAVRELSPTTTVVEYANGHCSPATHLEIRLWKLLLELNGG